MNIGLHASPLGMAVRGYLMALSRSKNEAGNVNYYEHWLGDYLKKTAGLTLIQEGAYRRLLDTYYIHEEPFRDDMTQICREVRAFTRHEKCAVREMLERFFRVESGKWIHDRAEEEIARFRGKSKKAQESANARWAKEKTEALANSGPGLELTEEDANASFQGMRTHAKRICESHAPQSPVPIPQSSIPIPIKLTLDSTRLSDEPLQGADLLGDLMAPGAPVVPDCPHREVLKVWAEVLPDMPQHLPAKWRGTRADHLRARWREEAAERGWLTQAEGLAFFRKFLTWCRRSPFLMGKVPPRQGNRQFEFELEWLVNPTNWAKVHEGKYHNQG